MSGIFASLNTSTKGLMASQTALHTTGHNISNINTPGYTRQRVDMKADKAFSYTGVGQLGTGVKMEAVVRMIDDHVSKQIRTENSTLNRYTEKSDVINQLEVIFNEPSDTGLNFNISEVFVAFQNLSGNPGDANFKTVAVEKLKTLTDALNHMGKQINDLEGETHQQIEKNVLDFNSKVEQLNMLNKQIFNISIKGQIPNDLLDQRDLLLKDVASIGEIKTDLDEYGRVSIQMSKKVGKEDKAENLDILTKEGTQKYIGYDKTPNGDGDREIKLYTEPYDPKDTTGENEPTGTIYIENGKILGNMDAIADVKKAKTSLDELANTIGQAINRVHGEMKVRNNVELAEGAELDDKHFDKKGNIFEFDNGAENGTASNIKINDALLNDNNLLRGGKHVAGESGYAQEDGYTALKLAGLRNIKIAFDENGIVVEKVDADNDKKDEAGNSIIKNDPNGQTIGGSYRDMVIQIGVSKQHSDNMVDNQIALTHQLEMRRESVSGVSLNDEITNVIKFQKAYEANAKVISVLTDMLDVLINRTGV